MSAHPLPQTGEVFEVRHPFVRATTHIWNDDGMTEVPTWNPGIVFEDVGPEDCGAFAHAEGKMILTVVDTFKPGRFPTRVFYTRSYVTPDGHAFGKSRLRIATVEKFRRLAKSFYHDYQVEDPV